MNKYIPDRIDRMKEYVPDTSSPSIKLDANECPFELPEKCRVAVLDTINRELCTLNRYPDPEMKELLSAYGEHLGVASELLVAGDGSDELINLIINTFLCDGGRILLCAPDFSMYEFYSEFSGTDVVTYEKKDGMRIDFGELAEIATREKVGLVMLSNPCNPTGVLEDSAEILRFVEAVDVPVVIDEAYMEFARKGRSLVSEVQNHGNLIVLKTVSKLGLAGLRCGFAIGPLPLINALKKTKSPYNMNTLTQAAVAAAMRNFDGILENINKIKQEVGELYTEVDRLSELGGFKVEESDTNFIYVRFCDAKKASSVHARLHQRRISVRLMNGGLRVTAGTKAENTEFIRELTVILKELAR